MPIKGTYHYGHLGTLTPEQRKACAEHERVHLEMSRARGHMTILEYEEAKVRSSGLERGDEVVDPPEPSKYNVKTDAAIEAVLAEHGIRRSSR